MSNGSFRSAMLDADRELAHVPAPREIRAALVARRRLRWRLPALAFAVAVAIAAIVIYRGRTHEPERELVAGFALPAEPTAWQVRGNVIEVLAPSLELDVPGFGQLVARRGTRVERITGGVHVWLGHVDVDVVHRPSYLMPAIVRVSHGTISVLGTRFTIDQSDTGGHVGLHEGKIQFDGSSRRVTLAPGFSLTWPLAAIAVAPAPAVPPTATVEPTHRSHLRAAAAPSDTTKTEPPTEPAPPALDIDQL